MNTKRVIIFLVLFLLTGYLSAQTDYRPGYIINNLGDTVFGKIDYRGDYFMKSICKFKVDDNNINEYTPNDIIAYRFTDGKFFVSKEIGRSKVFLEYLIQGQVSIFYLRDDNGDHYFIDKKDVGLSEIPYVEDIRYVNDKQIIYISKRHIGLLSYYMNDAPDLQSRIEKIKRPEHQNMIELAKDYHEIVCKDEKCMIFSKEISTKKASIEFIYGLSRFNVDSTINTNEFGILGYFWLPKANEKLYIKTGILYNPIYNYDNFIIKIPIQIFYQYSHYKIEPNFFFGTNTNFFSTKELKFAYYTLALGGGFNYRITDNFKLTGNVTTDFTPLLYLLEGSSLDLVNYSFSFGIKINI